MKRMMLTYKNQNLVSYRAFHDVAVACLNPSYFFSPCGLLPAAGTWWKLSLSCKRVSALLLSSPCGFFVQHSCFSLKTPQGSLLISSRETEVILSPFVSL